MNYLRAMAVFKFFKFQNRAREVIGVAPAKPDTVQFVYGHNKSFSKYLAIKNIPMNFLGKALIATCLHQKTYCEACRYCYGISKRSNSVMKAEQILSREG